jgi:hypothetical protein
VVDLFKPYCRVGRQIPATVLYANYLFAPTTSS